VSASPSTDIEPRSRKVDGVIVRHADTGGARDATLLLTSPWPESPYAFEPMWATLAERARRFAVDLTGFGAPERRDDLPSPRAMGAFLAGLVAEVGLDRPHLVTNAWCLHERLPHSRLELIDAGHFVWEEKPAEPASIILSSITGDGS
jgi:pimeloyl-ACP methyl ester carboxylesterase